MMSNKVLIIEDDPEQCRILSKLLERRHLEPSVATTLAEGIECARLEEYACVVLDLGLPDSPDSFTTAASIPRFAPAPVVVSTGSSEDKLLIRECLRHGAEYVTKASGSGEDHDTHGASLQLMSRVLQAIERRYPSPEIENQFIEVERERRKVRADRSESRSLHWVPVMSLALGLIIASLTGGAFLYRSVSGQAHRDEEITGHISTLDGFAKDFKTELLALRTAEMEMKSKLAIGEQDRASIRHNVESASAQQEQYRNEVLRRLERIEDHQLELLNGGKVK